MTPTSRIAGGPQRLLDDLVAELTDRFRDGDLAAIDILLRDHPSCADRLRSLLPALAVLRDLDASSASREGPRPSPPDPSDGVGVLGDFRIIGEIGRGGMGVVYEAEQISLGRRVALKVLPFASALDPQHLARFRIETQAAAVLHHPHIVPIYAVGCDRGVHYYAMQFIEGRTLAAAIAGSRRAPDGRGPADPAAPTPRRRLALARSAAALGLQAAEALEHAHSLGVIHRDIKPANLLIDAAGSLWVADFGLARLGDAAGPTRSDHLVGTLRYMPPEQALGRGVGGDKQADVYALGMTLYELLTLRPAFEATGRRALLRQVAFEEPKAPRSIDPAIPRDLETIVRKAIAKEPESRYSTAEELAADLRRFLDDRPIRARPPTPIGLAARWTRRHRAAVWASALTLMVTCSASSVMLWRENARTREALRVAESALDREREALRLTFAGSDLIASRAIRKLASGSATIGGQDGEFCRRALGHYERICSSHRDDPAMVFVVAAAEHRVGFLRGLLGLGEAQPRITRAVELYEAGIAGHPSDQDARKSLSEALDDLAILVESGRGTAEAEPARSRALRVRRGLASDFPGVPEYRISVALTLGYRIAPLLDQGKVGEAEASREELASSSDDGLGLGPAESAIRNDLAWLLASRRGGSGRSYRRAVELAGRAVEIAPDGRSAWNTLGVASYRAGDDRGAVRALEKSLLLRDGGDPYDWLFLALARHRLGDRDRARALFERSVAWIADRKSSDPDLVRFKAEAAEVFRD